MKDIKFCIELNTKEAVALSGVLALTATLNALPDATILCKKMLGKLTDAMEGAGHAGTSDNQSS